MPLSGEDLGWWEGGGSWRPDWPRWAGEIGKWGGGRPSGEGWRREGHAEPAQWRPRRLAPLVVPELLVPSILARQGAAPLISTLQPLPIHHRSSLISRRRRPHPQLWAEQLSPSQRWPPPQVSPVTLPYSFPSPECGVGTAAWLKETRCSAGASFSGLLAGGSGPAQGKPPAGWG